MALNSERVTFALTEADIDKLRKLSERYDGNLSMTVRQLIRAAFEALEKEQSDVQHDRYLFIPHR